MRRDETYWPGGFQPEHPSRNVQFEVEWGEELDEPVATYREYDQAGGLLVERPATDADLARWPRFDDR